MKERGYLIFASQSYKGVADVACESLRRWSIYPHVLLDCPDGFDRATKHRIEFFADGKLPFKCTCFIDADMVATPRVDTLFDYEPLVRSYPVAMLHEHNPDTLTRHMERIQKAVPHSHVKPTMQYLQMVPALWIEAHADFGRGWLRNYESTTRADEEAFNYTLWECGATVCLPTIARNPYNNQVTLRQGVAAVLHGHKDAQAAAKTLQDIADLWQKT